MRLYILYCIVETQLETQLSEECILFAKNQFEYFDDGVELLVWDGDV